jgi:hypothetical protein
MSANKFTLSGSGVEVEYTVGLTPGLAALTYKAGTVHKTFTTAEVQVDSTGLGQLVSVALRRTVDTGGERFGFFLPTIDVAMGKGATFHTDGVYEAFTGPDSVPARPASWRSIGLTGVAESVIVPL